MESRFGQLDETHGSPNEPLILLVHTTQHSLPNFRELITDTTGEIVQLFHERQGFVLLPNGHNGLHHQLPGI